MELPLAARRASIKSSLGSSKSSMGAPFSSCKSSNEELPSRLLKKLLLRELITNLRELVGTAAELLGNS